MPEMNKTCVQCHAENPEQARFCMNCGTALAGQSCANCQATLAATARFCDQCGHPAGNQLDSDRHRQTRLAAHAPETLTRKLMAEGKLSGERRVVTMLFADVVGSTSMGEQLDAESWTAIMNGAFERIMQPIYLYEGTIARLMGDALLAFFGAPIRHEDDPERAVKAGLALLDAAAAYSRDVEGRYGLRFQMRVGINTGEVVVGAVGSNLMYEYTAMGDAVNLAARMEQTAEPGTVQISEHTYAFLAPLLDVEPRGPIVIKGKAAPVEAFVVRGFRSQPGRRRGLGTGPTRLVGRKTEVAALEQAILQVAAGESRMVALLAEAGMGKSRLIEEARDIWQTGVGDGAPIFSFTGVSYETIHAYGPFREWLQAEAKTPADRQTLHRLLGGGVEPEADRVDKEEIFAFIVGLFEQAIGQRSALFVFDDLHWMDSASLEVILHLMKSTKDRPALLLLATRPEHSHPAWQVLAAGRSVYGNRLLELALEPLNAAESYALMTDAFVIQRLPSDVLEKIQTRAEIGR
ncbi:MAG: zinc-ribbon domain-containing protein, partial [Anaerolineae bacterium]